MTQSQIKEMHRHGFRFGSHTLTHCDLTSAASGVMREEIVGSKHRLEDLLGAAVTAFSYPWGLVNERARAAVAEAGYTSAVTTESRLRRDGDDALLIPRLTVSELDTPLGLVSKLLTGRDFARATPSRAWHWIQRRALPHRH
jgi:peptidoglycan/xylan/chitin deacetylase (PgdA/CDA1 family)